MNNKKKDKEIEDSTKASEPKESYSNSDAGKTIRFFSSFDEAEEYGRKKMAAHTPEERLRNLEILRKRFFSEKLLPNGKWPPLVRTIIIEKGTYL